MGGNFVDTGSRQLKPVVVVFMAVDTEEGLAGLAGIVSNAGPAELGELGGGGIYSLPGGIIERGVMFLYRMSFFNGSGGGGGLLCLLLVGPSLLLLLSAESATCNIFCSSLVFIHIILLPFRLLP